MFSGLYSKNGHQSLPDAPCAELRRIPYRIPERYAMSKGEHFVTGYAPGVGSNVEGALEVIPRPNAVYLNYFKLQ